MGFILYDASDLRRFLLKRDGTVSEAALLRHVTGFSSLPSSRKELYDIHFSLYHALYRLRESAGAEGFYLHLDPMRLRLLPLPTPGRCCYYFPVLGRYCGELQEGSPYCADHGKEHARLGRGQGIAFDPLREFYLNPDNIAFGDSDLLRKLLKGVMVYSFRRGEVTRALKFFGLTNPDRVIIRRRYRQLAREYHPDTTGVDDGRMAILNHSYQILLEVYTL
jgi:hypothetical protein